MLKKLFGSTIGVAILITAFWSSPARAINGFYLGVGGSYAFSELDTERISVLDDVDVDIEIDFGDTYGFNARLGWRPVGFFALEFNFDYLPGFESDDISEIIDIIDIPVSAKADLEIMTLMVDAKLTPLRLGPLEMSIFGGLGLMKAELEVSARSSELLGAASIASSLPPRRSLNWSLTILPYSLSANRATFSRYCSIEIFGFIVVLFSLFVLLSFFVLSVVLFFCRLPWLH